MNLRTRWSRVVFVVGAIAMVAGAADPLEGSVVVLLGSALLLLSEVVKRGERRFVAFWISVFVLVASGVAAMMVLSSVGGIGGKSGRSLWWGLLILPYPVGWLLGVGGVAAGCMRALRRRPGSGGA